MYFTPRSNKPIVSERAWAVGVLSGYNGFRVTRRHCFQLPFFVLFCACARNRTYSYLHLSLERRCVDTSALQNLQDTTIAPQKTGAIWTDSNHLSSLSSHRSLQIQRSNHSTPGCVGSYLAPINSVTAKVRWPWRKPFDEFNPVPWDCPAWAGLVEVNVYSKRNPLTKTSLTMPRLQHSRSRSCCFALPWWTSQA